MRLDAGTRAGRLPSVLFQVPPGDVRVESVGLQPTEQTNNATAGRPPTALFQVPPQPEPGKAAGQPRVRIVCGLTIVEIDPSIDSKMLVEIPSADATFKTPVLTPRICQE